MTKKDKESKKKVDETTNPSAPEEETNTDDSEVEADNSKNTNEEESESEESSASEEEGVGSSEEEIDYKSELEEETLKREKAERAIVKLKKKQKIESEEDEDPLTSQDIQEIVREEVGKTRMDEIDDSIDGLIEGMSDDEDERNLIEFHYKNSIVKSGFSRKQIKEDLAKAQAIANRKKIIRENRDVKKALKEQGDISNTGIGSNRSKTEVNVKELSKTDESFLRDHYRSQGLSEEQIEEKIREKN